MHIILTFLILSSFLSCKPSADTGNGRESASKSFFESDFEYLPKITGSDKLGFLVPGDELNNYIDLRGVGDSGWASIKVNKATYESGFFKGLKDFDPDKKVTFGDLNFINWETTVSENCSEWYNVPYPFLGNKSAVEEAVNWGFNLFSLSNNHAEDCKDSGKGRNGAFETIETFSGLQKNSDIVFSGLGIGAELEKPVITEKTIKGKKVKIAFAAISFLSWWTEFTTRYEYHGTKLLEAFKESDADIKILSIHTEGKLDRSKAFAEKFIKEAGGDTVFQHGPHTWAGVKVVEKPAGEKGVIFHGLGNFIHNQIGHNSENLIGRVLFDKETFQPKQVQVIPVENWVNGKDVIFKRTDKLPKSNFEWKKTGFGPEKTKAGYFSL